MEKDEEGWRRMKEDGEGWKGWRRLDKYGKAFSLFIE